MIARVSTFCGLVLVILSGCPGDAVQLSPDQGGYHYDSGLRLVDSAPDESADWVTLIDLTGLQGNSHHYFEISDQRCFNHLRLNIFPDGGIARLRVYGRVVSDAAALDSAQAHNLAAVELGARAIAWNDSHFGAAANLLNPGRGVNMGDGWETRRRREPGNDWCIVELGHPGEIEAALIDTAHFKGNYPDRCSLQAAMVGGGTVDSIITQSQFWPELLPPQQLDRKPSIEQ